MIWWESLAPKAILDSIKDLQEQAEKNRAATYDRHERYFAGSDTKGDLIRHVNEGGLAWKERQDRFADCGLTRRIAAALISPLAGHDIERTMDDANDAASDALAQVWVDSRIATKQRMIYQNQVVCGDAFAFVSWSDALGLLLVHTVDPGNVFVVPHEDDPMREWTVIERRIDPEDAKKMRYWIWTENARNLINADGVELDQGDGKRGWQANPYNAIPYIHWRGLPVSESYWGSSPISAVVGLHKYANNLRSQHDHVMLYQAHSQLVISDDNVEPKLGTGEANAIVLSKDGTATFLSPGADLPALERAYERAREEAFQIAGIPMSIVKGGEAPSGFALVIEYRSMSEVIEDLAVEAVCAEEDLIRLICTVGKAHGLPLPDDPVPVVDMHLEVLPTDKDAAYQRDLAGLQGTPQTVTLRDFLLRWSGQTEETVDGYMEALKAEQATRSTGFDRLAAFGNLPSGESVL